MVSLQHRLIVGYLAKGTHLTVGRIHDRNAVTTR